MAQHGFVFRKGQSWFLKYRENCDVDGKIVRKQKCVRLADYCDRYRCKKDVSDLVADKMKAVCDASKCPHSTDLFVTYVEETYLPFVLLAKKPSTYAGYEACFERYIKPWTGDYALRDFTVAIVARLLKDIAGTYRVNRDTVTKVRSILSGIFTYAMSEGHFPVALRPTTQHPAPVFQIASSLPSPPLLPRASRYQRFSRRSRICRSNGQLWPLSR